MSIHAHDREDTAEPAVRRPPIEVVHEDLKFANEYRQEFIKSLTLLSGALFAFSVTFRPQIHDPQLAWVFWLSWLGPSLSMFGGSTQLGCW
jgi:hypothetical protein